MTLYLLNMRVSMLAFMGTFAWFFFIVNVSKVPFSAALGLIDQRTLLINLVLVPLVVLGLTGGRWLTHRLPQRLFDGILLVSAGLAALRLVGIW